MSEGPPSQPVARSAKPRVVLLLLPSVHAGGSENYALRLVEFAGSEGFAWHVVSLDPRRGDLHDAFAALSVTLHYRSLGYANPLKVWNFFRLLRRLHVDTLCTFTGPFGGLPLTLGRLAGVERRIGWYRRSTPAFRATRPRILYELAVNRLLWRSATQVLANSEAALKLYRPPTGHSVPAGVIDNGVDARRFAQVDLSRMEARERLGLPREGFLVGHVGRFDPAKNHEGIFRTMAVVRKESEHIHFVFCGRDTDSEPFRSALRRHGVEDRAVLLGLQQDMPMVYRAFDLFFFPSLTEGQPNALIEAMLSGVPVLASEIEPIRAMLPETAQPGLLNPHDVREAARRILDASRGERTGAGDLQAWASARFDAERNFNAFLRLL